MESSIGVKIIKKKCPDCEGDLIRSKLPVRGKVGVSTYTSATGNFWRRPWRPIKRLYRLPELITFSWLCMNCKRVFFYLDDTHGDMIKAEYEEVMKERLQAQTIIPQNIIQDPSEL